MAQQLGGVDWALTRCMLACTGLEPSGAALGTMGHILLSYHFIVFLQRVVTIACRQTDRQTDRQTARQTGRQAGRQADSQTDSQTARQTAMPITWSSVRKIKRLVIGAVVRHEGRHYIRLLTRMD